MENWQNPLFYKEKKAIVNDFNGTGVAPCASLLQIAVDAHYTLVLTRYQHIAPDILLFLMR